MVRTSRGACTERVMVLWMRHGSRERDLLRVVLVLPVPRVLVSLRTPYAKRRHQVDLRKKNPERKKSVPRQILLSLLLNE